MRSLIEEYQYGVAAVKDILHGIDPLTDIEGKVSIHYVGYYYNSLLKDCVFILPKVLLRGGDKPTDGPELAKALEETKDVDCLTGSISIDPETHRPLGLGMWIYEVDGTEYVPLQYFEPEALS